MEAKRVIRQLAAPPTLVFFLPSFESVRRTWRAAFSQLLNQPYSSVRSPDVHRGGTCRKRKKNVAASEDCKLVVGELKGPTA